jgi:hypothetical protein
LLAREHACALGEAIDPEQLPTKWIGGELVPERPRPWENRGEQT